LAKELAISTKELLDVAKQNGQVIKNPLCSLEPGQEQDIRSWLKKAATGSEERTATADSARETTTISKAETAPATKSSVVEEPRLPVAGQVSATTAHEGDSVSAKPLTIAVIAEKVKEPAVVQASGHMAPVKAGETKPIATAAVLPKEEISSAPVNATSVRETRSVVAVNHIEVPAVLPKETKVAPANKITQPEVGKEDRRTLATTAGDRKIGKDISPTLQQPTVAKGVLTEPRPATAVKAETHIDIPTTKVQAKGVARESPVSVVSNTGKTQTDKGVPVRPPLPGKTEIFPKMPRKIEVSVPISVKDLSQAIGVRTNLILQKISESSKNRVTLNESLDETMVEWLGLEFGKDLQAKKGENIEEAILKEIQKEDKPQDLKPRAPVVTFMGHVNHGKTSLLDRIRQTDIAAHEAGGITQHIGAHKVKTEKHEIVFLDTPGHEAFTLMRSRGAHLTDIVVLVVAADDGVMPQTREAISHARAANVPIVVALNKIDKQTARPEVVIQQLMKENLIPEKWGGETGFFDVSALTGQGIPELLEYLGLMGEILELKANPKRKAMGVVIEAKIMEGKGVVSTLLVQNGTLRRGDNILCGTSCGRVRDITDHLGKNIHEAGPSTPGEISGLADLPEAGDKFYVVDDPGLARTIAEGRKKNLRDKQLAKGVRKITIEDIMKQIQKAETPELRIILKTDVHGSLEAIAPKLESFSAAKVKLKLLHAAVGGINERDIQLSDASQAIVLGFNVTANKMAREMAETKKIQIRYYSIIYQMFEDVRNIMQGLLVPESKEETTGHATIRKVITLSKAGKVAGCYITDGVIERSSHIRISRNGVVLNKERPLAIASLKHFKEDVGKVKEGFECGIRLDGFDDLKEGDELEAFKTVSVAQKLD
jgi:translation initiation factor IF-2